MRAACCALVAAAASSLGALEVRAYEGGSFTEPASAPVQVAPQLTRAPTVLTFIPAPYPESEKGKGNVEVVLVLFLDAQGNVTKATAKDRAELPAAFVEAAEAAAMRLKFVPAEVDGKPSAIGLEFRYAFTEDLAAASAPASLAAAETASQPASQVETAAAPRGNAALKGEVREAGTRLRLANVVVRLEAAGVDEEALTDEKGRFTFADLPAGAATLTVASEQHRTRKFTYKLEANVELSEKLYVQPNVISPYETTVVGKREQREVTKRVITREELIKVPGSLGDPLRAIQNFPSVARPPLLGGALVIRGASPNSSEFYVDGMKLPVLYHFGQGPSVLPERMIEDIAFMPCCFSTRYGRATAGVIEVGLRKPDVRKWSGKASADLGIASLFMEVPITDNLSISAAARRSYYDAVLPVVLRLAAPPLPGQVQNPTLVPVFWDYQTRLVWKTHGAGDFALFIFGSDDRLAFIQTPTQQTSAFNPSELNVTLTFHTIQPTWTLKLTPNLTNTLTLQANYELNTANTPETNFSLGEVNFGLREELRYKVSDNLNLITGTDWNVAFNNLKTRLPLLPRFPTFPAPGTENPPFTQYDNNQEVVEIGWYTEAEWKLGKLRLLPGVRLEHIGYAGRSRQAVMPRASAKYKILDNVELKAAVGLFQKRPPLINIIREVGNPDLELENALQSTVGVEWSITQALSLETSVFANYLWGEATSTNAVRLVNGQLTPLIYDNSQIGRVYGAELLLRYKPYKNFFGWVAYTLSRSERNTGDDWFLFNFDQTHILILVASYVLPYGFQIGARFRLVSGNPTTGTIGSVWDADTGNYRRVNGPFRGSRLPLFHQLDIRIDKKFVLPWFSLNLYLDVQNVYNQGNAEFSQFSFDFSRQQFFTGIPILPVLGLEGQW